MGKGANSMAVPVYEDTAKRVHNFSAGPACLPESVMRTAAADFCSSGGSGIGMMEMSHRDPGGPVQSAISQAAADLRSLLSIPDSYHVLFMQGGAHGQFAAVPLNLLGEKKQADYLDTGFWSQRAMKEAERYCTVRLAYDGKEDSYTKLPPASAWSISPDSAYVHICANETIHGVELLEDPELPPGSPPLVGDFTSTLLSRPVDVSKYGLIYASGGKNLGPAGFTVVIVRDDLLDRASPMCPSVLSYQLTAGSKPIPSLYNTPPTFLIYMCGLVVQDLKKNGGLPAVQRRVCRRANQIYTLIEDSNGFYTLKNVDKSVRSRMNIPFRVMDGSVEGLEESFCAQAEASGIFQLFCHPLFPGLRVTLYNGVPDEAVNALHLFMLKFMADHSDSVQPPIAPPRAVPTVAGRQVIY